MNDVDIFEHSEEVIAKHSTDKQRLEKCKTHRAQAYPCLQEGQGEAITEEKSIKYFARNLRQLPLCCVTFFEKTLRFGLDINQEKSYIFDIAMTTLETYTSKQFSA